MNRALMTDERFGIHLEDTLVADVDFANDSCLLQDDQGKAKEQLDRVPNWALKTGPTKNVNRKCSEHKPQQELDVQCG